MTSMFVVGRVGWSGSRRLSIGVSTTVGGVAQQVSVVVGRVEGHLVAGIAVGARGGLEGHRPVEPSGQASVADA